MLSLIIPTFNEKENIEPLISKIRTALQYHDYELIIVDDDSRDNTWQEVERLMPANPRLHLIRRVGRRGLSSAVIEGFQLAKGDILGVMDADHSHDAALLPKMIDLIQSGQADCVVGSRRILGGGVDRWPWHRRLASDFATILARSFTGLHIQDPMSGFFCIPRNIFINIASRLKPKGYKILLEILARTKEVQIVELPYIFQDRRQGYSKLSLYVIVLYVRQLISLFLHRIRISFFNW